MCLPRHPAVAYLRLVRCLCASFALSWFAEWRVTFAVALGLFLVLRLCWELAVFLLDSFLDALPEAASRNGCGCGQVLKMNGF
jgi:hypothetical protein